MSAVPDRPASSEPVRGAQTPRTVAVLAGQLAVGGAERQLFLWLSHIDRDRFRPVVVTLHPDSGDHWESRIESLGIPLLRVPRKSNRLSRLAELVRVLRPWRPDLIHGWHLFTGPYAGAAARLLRARASLGSLRGSLRAYRELRAESLLTEWLTDAILVNSRHAAEQLAAIRPRWKERVFAVPNAVEDRIEERGRARAFVQRRWGVPDSRVWIGSSGRFQESKRFDLLIDMAAALLKTAEDFHLLLIGDGECRDALREKTRELRLDGRVTFTGEEPDSRFWLSALDVFCFPSMDEGMPNAVMEAAVAGVPVVGWASPFLRELLDDGRAGVLVEPGDHGALERELRALVRAPARRQQLAQTARRHVLERFGIPPFVEGLTGAYEELLAGGRRRRYTGAARVENHA